MPDMTFSDLARGIVATYQGRVPDFPRMVDFWIGQFNERKVSTLTNSDVEDGLDALMQRGRLKAINRRDGNPVEIVQTGEPLSPATVNRHLSALGSIFKAARRMRLLPRGYITPTRGVGRMNEGPGRTVTVTPQDIHRLVDAARLSRNRKLAALIAVAATTGLRLGSLQSVTWADVNLKDGFIDIERTKNGTPHRAVLLPWVITEMNRMRPTLPLPQEPVFPQGRIMRSLRTALLRAGLPETWSFHHLRHAAASILAQSGASVPQIMAVLGHKSPAMALRYSHLNVASVRDSMTQAWRA